MPTIITALDHTPEVLIVDGGAMHTTTSEMLRARGMRQTARVRSKMTMVWRLTKQADGDAEVFDRVADMAGALDEAMQRRQRRAYDDMGGYRFKGRPKPADFHLRAIEGALTAATGENWGE